MCLCIFVRLPSAVLNVAFILKFNSLTCTLIRLVIYQGLLNSLKSLFLIILTIILFCKEKASNTILRSTFLTLKDIHWKKIFQKLFIGWEHGRIYCAGYKYYSAQVSPDELQFHIFTYLTAPLYMWSSLETIKLIEKKIKRQQNWQNESTIISLPT